ncbi:hypothetical protein [Granulicella paludicola]|uniref:hypothetical protein n=1 Tax=Granulicella paludicola TaxID=474951 RepID=UPI0021E0B13A|nr:hypothetical protein [Granulicella paludicola]
MGGSSTTRARRRDFAPGFSGAELLALDSDCLDSDCRPCVDFAPARLPACLFDSDLDFLLECEVSTGTAEFLRTRALRVFVGGAAEAGVVHAQLNSSAVKPTTAVQAFSLKMERKRGIRTPGSG